jgi:hypothetical protein
VLGANYNTVISSFTYKVGSYLQDFIGLNLNRPLGSRLGPLVFILILLLIVTGLYPYGCGTLSNIWFIFCVSVVL